MDGYKTFLASRTVWGGIVALLAGIGGLLGFNLGDDVQSSLVENLTAGGAALGGLVSIIGRILADKKLG